MGLTLRRISGGGRHCPLLVIVLFRVMKVSVLSCHCRLTDLVPNVRRYSTVAPGALVKTATNGGGTARLVAEAGQRGLDRLPAAA